MNCGWTNYRGRNRLAICANYYGASSNNRWYNMFVYDYSLPHIEEARDTNLDGEFVSGYTLKDIAANTYGEVYMLKGGPQ